MSEAIFVGESNFFGVVRLLEAFVNNLSKVLLCHLLQGVERVISYETQTHQICAIVLGVKS